MILEEKGNSSSGTDNLLDRDMNTVEDTTEKFIRPYHAQESAKKPHLNSTQNNYFK